MVIDRESSRILPATRRLWTHQLAMMAGKRRKSSATNQWLSGYLCDEMTSNLDDSICDDFSVASCQWEFQDPKMEVPYHIKPYFGCISPYIGLINGRYLQFRYLKLPLNSLSQSNRPLLENPPFISIYMCIHIYIYIYICTQVVFQPARFHYLRIHGIQPAQSCLQLHTVGGCRPKARRSSAWGQSPHDWKIRKIDMIYMVYIMSV